eukprot:CAMPEP_0203966368 /NCGR_PEP_ID=MMETSP0359-20131031/95636_1 /ASSEMBLY_ACC=CAM_ASM_000338 /TAXON_ID=268821 /ORGANISM="Scrippsiella Hangoei, Strain SHTV-5" /LENGTH=71 /DNA_ID=CAMNT_0050903745 /DNA_START=268 /DNA_END=483 /DNA_ORIENTATION=-
MIKSVLSDRAKHLVLLVNLVQPMALPPPSEEPAHETHNEVQSNGCCHQKREQRRQRQVKEPHRKDSDSTPS